ncbi:hypothetical protein PUN28_015257 [Cardiocondyla obscurior]|uniref:Secreted protein n=1 Tax=Cardiocondyla obscurior TaxID=286306 RepID=A0AAW2F2H5_9HYME
MGLFRVEFCVFNVTTLTLMSVPGCTSNIRPLRSFLKGGQVLVRPTLPIVSLHLLKKLIPGQPVFRHIKCFRLRYEVLGIHITQLNVSSSEVSPIVRV